MYRVLCFHRQSQSIPSLQTTSLVLSVGEGGQFWGCNCPNQQLRIGGYGIQRLCVIRRYSDASNGVPAWFLPPDPRFYQTLTNIPTVTYPSLQAIMHIAQQVVIELLRASEQGPPFLRFVCLQRFNPKGAGQCISFHVFLPLGC